MKKYFIFLLVVIFIPFTVHGLSHEKVFYVNSNGIEMTEQEYDNLLSVGFTEFQIKNMSLSEFNDNKDLHGQVEASVKKYYKTVTNTLTGKVIESREASYDEFLREKENPTRDTGFIMTSWIQMTNNIITISDYYKRYKADMFWMSMPPVRSFDTFAIGFNDYEIEIVSSVIPLTIVYTYSDGTDITQTAGYTQKITSKGAGVSFKLPSEHIVGLSSYMYYNIGKITSSEVTSLISCSDYVHANRTSTLARATDYTLDFFGIVRGVSMDGYYNYQNCAQASWEGSW